MENRPVIRRQNDTETRKSPALPKPASASKLQEARKRLAERRQAKRHPVGGKGL